MTASPWPDHLLTLDEFTGMPEDNSRIYELVEGILHVSPRPVPAHQRLIKLLARQLDDQLPYEWEAAIELDLVVRPTFPPTVRVPDLMVVPEAHLGTDVKLLHARDAPIAIEVVSPGSQGTDNITKRSEYAEAGIPYYWIVTVGPKVTLTPNQLMDGSYRQDQSATGTYTTEQPFPLSIDLDALTRRPAR